MQKNNSELRLVLTVANIILIVLCIAATILMLVPVVLNQISGQDKPVFGHYLYINNNSNLEPVMKQNDLVVVKPMSITEFAVGDFLCYYPDDAPDTALFAKIVGFEGDELYLSDKADHSTTVNVNDIIVAGKATSTIFALGDIAVFLRSSQNRLFFYIIVGATALILVGITILLHIFRKPAQELSPLPIPPVSYRLDDLVQLEEDPIDFEISPNKEDLLHQ